MEFVLDAIREHKGSDLYKTAYDAELYYKHQNPTIMRFQKFVYNQFGQKVPDIWSPNNKIASNWYNYFTTQAVSYLLGNGVTFQNESNKDKLGNDFDKKVQDIATHAKMAALLSDSGTLTILNASLLPSSCLCMTKMTAA